ncbi:HAD-like domain-containing protein [Paraphysoderma sedebokerense]|nr:HAD-like domain-containing protein [Paraphysoderma sedebokerense]
MQSPSQHHPQTSHAGRRRSSSRLPPPSSTNPFILALAAIYARLSECLGYSRSTITNRKPRTKSINRSRSNSASVAPDPSSLSSPSISPSSSSSASPSSFSSWFSRSTSTGNLRRSQRIKSKSDHPSWDPSSSYSQLNPSSSSSSSGPGSPLKSRNRSLSSLGLTPPILKKKTLVLDLDETLIHSTSRGVRGYDYMIEVMVEKHNCLYYVYKRPYVDVFLAKVSEWYNLVIFTASMPEYADPVIDFLDGSRNILQKRYFRADCTNYNGIYMKDLTIVDQDLSQVALLDNSPVSYAIHQENGIPIEGWINDPHDEALLDLLPFLDALRFTEDVRSILGLRICS